MSVKLLELEQKSKNFIKIVQLNLITRKMGCIILIKIFDHNQNIYINIDNDKIYLYLLTYYLVYIIEYILIYQCLKMIK